jgi:hypothetical protein
MTAREEELALLGVLEASLGERQRALAGLHVDERAARRTLTDLLNLEKRIDEKTRRGRAEQRAAAERRAATPPGPRHKKPRRAVFTASAVVVLTLVGLLSIVWLV